MTIDNIGTMTPEEEHAWAELEQRTACARPAPDIRPAAVRMLANNLRNNAYDVAARTMEDLLARVQLLEAAPAASAEPVAWVAADTLHSPHPRCVSSLAYVSQIDQDRGREYVPLYAAPVAEQKADDARDAVQEFIDATDALLESQERKTWTSGYVKEMTVGERMAVAARWRKARAALAAQKADDARDAARWREVERRATKKTAYDRYGNGAYWSVGVFSGDSRQTFGETIDAAIDAARQGEGGAE